MFLRKLFFFLIIFGSQVLFVQTTCCCDFLFCDFFSNFFGKKNRVCVDEFDKIPDTLSPDLVNRLLCSDGSVYEDDRNIEYEGDRENKLVSVGESKSEQENISCGQSNCFSHKGDSVSECLQEKVEQSEKLRKETELFSKINNGDQYSDKKLALKMVLISNCANLLSEYLDVNKSKIFEQKTSVFCLNKKKPEDSSCTEIVRQLSRDNNLEGLCNSFGYIEKIEGVVCTLASLGCLDFLKQKSEDLNFLYNRCEKAGEDNVIVKRKFINRVSKVRKVFQGYINLLE